MTRSLRILVVQGHRNTSGGDPEEAARTPKLARAIATALRADGHEVDILQGDDDWFDGSLDEVGRAVMARYRSRAIDLMLDIHLEGDANNTQGVFAIVPDGDGLRTLTGYDGSDSLAANDLDRAFARGIAHGISGSTGLGLRRTGVVEPGVMSERATHVGADLGWRLAMFGYTAPARDRMVRLVIECGNLHGDREIIDDPGFPSRLGTGVVRGVRAALADTPARPIQPDWPRHGTLRWLAEPKLVTVTADALNARQWADTSTHIHAVFDRGRKVWVCGSVIGEQVEGNPVWWITGKSTRTKLHWRIWSGGTDCAGVDALAVPGKVAT